MKVRKLEEERKEKRRKLLTTFEKQGREKGKSSSMSEKTLNSCGLKGREKNKRAWGEIR